MIRLILVRHGNTFEKSETPVQVGSRTDLPLTQEGMAQIRQLAQFFLAENIQPRAIYTGSLQRQKKTAELLSQALGVSSMVQERALTEIDYGLWEGLTSSQIEARWKKESDAWSNEGKWPEEVFSGTLEEHLLAIDEWKSALCHQFEKEETILGVTSNGIIRLFHPRWRETQNLKVKTGYFCELFLSPTEITVKTWNQAPTFLAL